MKTTNTNCLCNFSLISEESISFFNGLYDKPWTRLSPYIFGICIGYVIHKIDTKLEISIGMMSCGNLIISQEQQQKTDSQLTNANKIFNEFA